MSHDSSPSSPAPPPRPPDAPLPPEAARLARLDHDHVWHPFTAMRQWRQSPPLIIARAEGEYLIDLQGRRYIDGVSSLWCNVHGHRVPAIDRAIRAQLDQVAHTTLLGLASPPSIELAARLVRIAPREPGRPGLNKVFYSDAGATAVEAALKMAVGYWHHRGRPRKSRFIALGGAYHGDTTGGMSVGFSELFHRPFGSMVFPVTWAPAPDALRPPAGFTAPSGWPGLSPRAPATGGVAGADPRNAAMPRFMVAADSGASPNSGGQPQPPGLAELWPSERPHLAAALRDYCLDKLRVLLEHQADDTAAIVIEPVMQGAAGMVCQPAGFLRGVADLARRHEVLLIADEVATGFGRTGCMFACEHEGAAPDLLCLGKGLSGGYLPLAATLAADEIEQAFCGEFAERRTFFHGHTYTGNALACAAALASLDLFEESRLLEHICQSERIIADRLGVLRDAARFPHVIDVRQRGIMAGIELGRDRQARESFDFTKRTGHAVCLAMRERGLILRPLGDVIVLMPIPAMPHATLERMLDIVVQTLGTWRF